MSSPQPGDVLTTVEQLDACPEGTIVRYSDVWVFVHRDDGEWEVTGAVSARTSDEVFDAVDEVTVIWLPAPTKAETTIDRWHIDAEAVWFPHTRELVDLLHSVPLTGRVRVTVERIGADE